MYPSEKHNIQINRVFKAPISQIYQLLSNEEYINLYIEGSTFEPFEGGKYSLFDNWVSGDILELKNNRKIKLTWKPTEWDTNTAHSTVLLEFETHPQGTLIRLTHTNLPSQSEADAHVSGWEEFVFMPLEEFLKL